MQNMYIIIIIIRILERVHMELNSNRKNSKESENKQSIRDIHALNSIHLGFFHGVVYSNIRFYFDKYNYIYYHTRPEQNISKNRVTSILNLNEAIVTRLKKYYSSP